MAAAASLVDPDGIPYTDVVLEGVTAAAAEFRTAGGGVRDGGSAVVTSWAGLSTSYSGPSDTTLFESMTPVGTTTDSLGSDLEAMAKALDAFVEEARPIVDALKTLKADATTLKGKADSYEGSSFLGIAWSDNWDQDGDLNDENTRIVNGVADKVVAYQAAERTCANAIRALSGLAPLHAIQGEDDPLGYGYEALPEGTELPWGRSNSETGESCVKNTVTFIPDLVGGVLWDGIAVGVVWGTLQLLGFGPGFWSLDNLGTMWGGMGTLIGRDPETGEFAGDTAKDAWGAFGLEMVAADEWSEDPGRALGASAFNIVTTVVPVIGWVGKISKAGKAAEAGSVAARAAQVVKLVELTSDPFTWVAKGSKLVLPTLSDIARNVTSALSPAHLGDITDFRGVDVPSLEGGRFELDGVHADVEVPAPRSEAPAAPPATADVPVRAPEPAHVGGGGHHDGGTSGSGGGGPGAAPSTSSGGGAPSAPAPGVGLGDGPAGSGPGSAGDLPTGDAPPTDLPSGDGPPGGGTPGGGDPADGTPADGGQPGPSEGSQQPGTPGRPPLEWTPDMGDPVLSDADFGPDWTRADDRGDAVDPNYGDVRPTSGTTPAGYDHPGVVDPAIEHLISDPGAPWGRDVDGTPFSQAEYDARYVDAEGLPRYPGNDGAVSGSYVEYTTADSFARDYGSQIDRLGDPSGGFLSLPDTPFEQRSLPPSNLRAPYSIYELTGDLPAGARIEVSEVAPAFGRPGGGIQVRVLDAFDEAMTVDQMIDEGVVTRTDVDGADGSYVDTSLGGVPDVVPPADQTPVPHVDDATDFRLDGALDDLSDAATPVAHDQVPVVDDATAPDTTTLDPDDLGPDAGDLPVDARVDDKTTRVVQSGGKGGWSWELNHPQADTRYVVDDRFVFETDHRGRVDYSEAQLDPDPVPAERSPYQQGIAGKPDRLPGDQGGHIWARVLGGPGEAVNLTAMHETLNSRGQADYRVIERAWEEQLASGVPVHASVDVRYDGDLRRPATYVVKWVDVDGVPQRSILENVAGPR